MTDDEIQRMIDISFRDIEINKDVERQIMRFAKAIEGAIRHAAVQIVYDCADQINNMNKEAAS